MRTTVALSILVAILQLCTCQKRCPSDFCDNKKLNCPAVSCITGSIIIQSVPEACRCCEGCYRRLSKYSNFLIIFCSIFC
nr:unnamed protein product [Callosobruchus chinensis]